MPGSVPTKSIEHDEDTEAQHSSTSILTRKVWLPKLIYAAIPYFYIIVGSLTLAATIYIHHWIWIVPHYFLFSVVCLHMGIVIHRRRRRARRRSRQPENDRGSGVRG